ncbi:hypothetical protein [Enterobacter ludwigii]|uniref:hypothetical protein n=1 Tax=Enterobacter ludwigii TaxID=299767 RepID=UPI003974CD21
MVSTIYSNTAEMRHFIRESTGVKGLFAHATNKRESVYQKANSAGATVKLTDNQLNEIKNNLVTETIRVTSHCDEKEKSEFHNLMQCISDVTDRREDQITFQTITERIGKLATAIDSYLNLIGNDNLTDGQKALLTLAYRTLHASGMEFKHEFFKLSNKAPDPAEFMKIHNITNYYVASIFGRASEDAQTVMNRSESIPERYKLTEDNANVADIILGTLDKEIATLVDMTRNITDTINAGLSAQTSVARETTKQLLTGVDELIQSIAVFTNIPGIKNSFPDGLTAFVEKIYTDSGVDIDFANAFINNVELIKQNLQIEFNKSTSELKMNAGEMEQYSSLFSSALDAAVESIKLSCNINSMMLVPDVVTDALCSGNSDKLDLWVKNLNSNVQELERTSDGSFNLMQLAKELVTRIRDAKEVRNGYTALQTVESSQNITTNMAMLLANLTKAIERRADQKNSDKLDVQNIIKTINEYIEKESNDINQTACALNEVAELNEILAKISTDNTNAIKNKLSKPGTAARTLGAESFQNLQTHLNNLAKRADSMIVAVNEAAQHGNWPDDLKTSFSSLARISLLEDNASTSDVMSCMKKICAVDTFATTFARYVADGVFSAFDRLYPKARPTKNHSLNPNKDISKFIKTMGKVLRQMEDNANQSRGSVAGNTVVPSSPRPVSERANDALMLASTNMPLVVKSLLFLNPDDYSFKEPYKNLNVGENYSNGLAAKKALVQSLDQCSRMSSEYNVDGKSVKVTEANRPQAWTRPRQMINIVSDFVGSDGAAKLDLKYSTGGHSSSITTSLAHKLNAPGKTGQWEMAYLIALGSGYVPYIASLQNLGTGDDIGQPAFQPIAKKS